MKHSRRPWVRLAVLAMFVLAALSTASAQSLHAKWFKVLVKADTCRVNPYTGFFSSYKFQFYIYVYLHYAGPGESPRGSLYDWEVWSKTEGGRWECVMEFSESSSSQSENFFPDINMSLPTEKGDNFSTYVTPRIVASPLSNTFVAGGEIYAGRDINGRRLYGWLTMTGKLVPMPKWVD
ncbi:MAG: hypothetical protein PHH18_09815 [Acidobacteriota bacterium]|nr:hypothetical protein [Acidobacteriota bacterium]